MREQISTEQHHLKINQARVPDRGRSPEDRQDHLADHRLDRKQKHRRQERRQAEQDTTIPDFMDSRFVIRTAGVKADR